MSYGDEKGPRSAVDFLVLGVVSLAVIPLGVVVGTVLRVYRRVRARCRWRSAPAAREFGRRRRAPGHATD